jgi:cytochrome b subunit of formate dehydrogenase
MVALLVSVAGDAGAQHGPGGPHGGGADTTRIRGELGASVHRNLGCASCHGGMEHAQTSDARTSCAGCHRAADVEHQRGAHGHALRRDGSTVPTCVSCHGTHAIRSARERSAATSPARTPDQCRACHAREATDFIASVHGRALASAQTAAPSCTTCHGAHAAWGPAMSGSPVGRRTVADTCGRCHVEPRLEFRRSVHGSAVSRGVPHAPTCTTCHGVHAVPTAQAPTSPTSRLRVAGETCARCHASERITSMHDLPGSVLADFRGSYHGIAGARGDRRVANCASCHGYHGIRPSSSPYARTNAANLARTCGECHPGAAGLFARGGIHHTTRTFGHRLVDLVGTMYGGMIAMVIGLMAVHNGLDFQRRWRERRRAPEPTRAGEYLRFTLNERVQHWLLAGSFVTLAVTGFALRFAWPMPPIGGEAPESLRAGAHRAAAVIFGGLALYHLGYLMLTARGRDLARAILPRLRSAADAVCCGAACARLGPPTRADWRELIATVRYNVGLARARPAYGRFTYWEKMEYWSLVWGAVVMISTGVVLWLEVPVLNRVPYWAYELVRTVHFYEATLAVLAIVVWHFYYVAVNPDVFPLNRAMTRGTLTAAEMERDHALALPKEEQR